MDPAERARLEDAYRRTTYAAGLSIRLRVGEPHPFLDGMLEFRGLDEYAYLTAWNPQGKKLSDAENAARQSALLARLKGRHVVQGVATADDGAWSEAGALVLGIPREEAMALGLEFDQLAILTGRRGGTPEIVWL